MKLILILSLFGLLFLGGCAAQKPCKDEWAVMQTSKGAQYVFLGTNCVTVKIEDRI